jgi:ketosteroid isomerase-like protein
MTANKQTVQNYMAAFRVTDHAAILDCLTDDVEWEVPGAFHISGKEAFDGHIEGEGFVINPDITVHRLTEENDVVIAEGAVKTRRVDGTVVNLVFCDVFEMRGGKIRKLISYLMAVA